jgi:tRNA (cytidine/uridine-2'-O-)-methyltransferase
MIDCALFEPDIPQNAGAVLRLGACFGATIHIIHPIGFTLNDRTLRRVGMDYIDLAKLLQHADWSGFQRWQRASGRRLVALTTKGAAELHDFQFAPDDVLLMGRESAGLPDMIHAAADARLRIPMWPAARSLNLANAAAIALFEALRQTGQLAGA